MLALTCAFLIIDLAFWGATIIKVPEGGWFPLVVAAIIFTFMSTWKKGRNILADHMKSSELPLEKFMDDISAQANVKESEIKRVEGTAVYMYSNPQGTPPALLHNIKHNKVIHKNIIILSVQTTEEIPYVSQDERVEVKSVGDGFYQIVIRNGFTQGLNVPNILKNIDEDSLTLDMEETTFFLGKKRILPADKETSRMAKWRDHLFGAMVRNQQPATTYFNLPPNRVVELGAQLEL